jgi:hypothetical protein
MRALKFYLTRKATRSTFMKRRRKAKRKLTPVKLSLIPLLKTP